MNADGRAPVRRGVPACEVRLFAPRRSAYCVVIPVLDEGPRILRQLGRMDPGVADIVIADGGSTDGSLAAPPNVRAVLTRVGPGGLGAQLRMGFAWALEEGYEGLIAIDGNDKDDVSAIPRFVAALREGWDHVQGSRYVPGGQGVRTPLYRHLGVRLLHAPLISLAAGVRYTDTTNGFRGYSRRFLLDDRVAVFRDRLSGYELHYYLAIRAARLGFRVCELPVTRTYPEGGPVPSKLSPWRGSFTVLRALAGTVLGRYDP